MKWLGLSIVFAAACNFGNEEIMPFDSSGNFVAPYTTPADPRAPDVPVKKRGWATSGTLQTDGASSVSLQADFHDSGIYTVQFGVNVPDGQIYNAVADVSWTVEGNTIQRRINVANGTSISGGGQAVSIKLRDDSVPLIVVPTQNGSYDVTISITPGARATSSVPPILKSLPTATFVLALGVLSVPVPQTAGVRSVQCLVAAGTGVTKAGILVQSNTNTALAESDGSIPEFVPLVPGCTSVSFFSTNAVAGQTVTILFGVDG